MKKRLLPFLIILLLLVAAALFWRHNGEAESGAQLTLYGNIDVRVANLAFEASGRIAGMALQEGERVEAGQRLAWLDDSRLQLNLDAAQAQYEVQQARLKELLAGSRPEQVAQFRAQLEAARIEAENARRNASRLRDLAQQKLATPRDVDDARAAADVARARAAAAEATLRLAEAGSRAETIDAARASVAAAQAQLSLMQKNLKDSVLYAPQGGIIQSRILEPGDMASPDRPAYILVMTEPLWARAYVAETELGRVKPGLPVAIQSDSFPERRYAGWVGSIAPSAEFTPKSVETTEIRSDLVYQARVYLCSPSDELRQGMPVTVTIDTAATPQSAAPCPSREAATGAATP